MSTESNPNELAKIWAQNPYFDEKDRNELTSILDNTKEVTERFYKDLEFGTGGLRSIIGMGSNRINKYNVRKATQAMANQVLKTFGTGKSVAISYDCRNFSDEFSKEAACVFAANGMKVYLFSELTATPLLSFALRKLDCVAGVMITASHNPKEYNGFKAYWADGAQLTPPIDGLVISEYEKISSWDQIKFEDFESAKSSGKIEFIKDDVIESFYQTIDKYLVNRELTQKSGEKLKVLYTSLHGTGLVPCRDFSHRQGMKNFDILAEQASFDGNFSTVVTTPNPEDPKALKQAVDKMLAENYDLVYGTDPDCDRLGVVVNKGGNPIYLNGNQIATLMLFYLYEQHKLKGTLPKNPLVIKSIVTTNLMDRIGEHFGGTTLSTLTGFKWMMHLWRELTDKGTDFDFLFASEESFGYMLHEEVRDKDAVSAIALFNELALYYKVEKGLDVVDQLDEIYKTIGFCQESLIAKTYAGLEGADKIKRIMEHFRGLTSNFAGESIAIKDDYSTLTSRSASGEVKMLSSEKSNVLGFHFESGHKLFVRPSGTEPKIKFYTQISLSEGELSAQKEKADLLIKHIESEIHKVIDPL